MSRLARSLLGLVTAMSIAACAAPDAISLAPVPTSFDRFEYAPLDVGATRFNIADRDPYYGFETGRSRFRAFRLPSREQPATLTVSSFSDAVTGGWFQPDLLLLDDRFQLVQHIGEPLRGLPNLRRVDPVRQSISSSFPIEPRATYLIVRTTDALLAARITETQRRTLAMPSTLSAMPDGQGFATQWPTGELELDLSRTPR